MSCNVQCGMASEFIEPVFAQHTPHRLKDQGHVRSIWLTLNNPINWPRPKVEVKFEVTLGWPWPEVKGQGQMSRSKVKVTIVDILTYGWSSKNLVGGPPGAGLADISAISQFFHHDWNLEYIISTNTINAMTRLLYVPLEMMTFNSCVLHGVVLRD
jgi:hypothetical protein